MNDTIATLAKALEGYGYPSVYSIRRLQHDVVCTDSVAERIAQWGISDELGDRIEAWLYQMREELGLTA